MMLGTDLLGLEAERLRCSAINELGRLHQRRDLADVAIFAGWPVPMFRDELLKTIVPEGRARTAIGLSQKEIRQYSLFRVFGATVDATVFLKPCLEREASEAVAKAIGRTPCPGGLFVPAEILQRRDLTVASASGGGFTVGTTNVSFLEALYKRLIPGLTIVSDLREHAMFPRMSGTSTGYWLATESTAITAGDETFEQLALTPKTVGATTTLSRQLTVQSSPSAEAVVMTDLANVLAVAMNTAALAGTGSGGQPQGIIGTSGVGSVNGASLTYDLLLEFQSDVLAANAMVNPAACRYITTNATAKLLANRQRFTGVSDTLWQGNLADGVLAGFPAMSTGVCPTSHVIFGDWSQCLVGEWGVLELATDPFTNFKTGKIALRALYTVDIGLRHAASFCVATAVS